MSVRLFDGDLPEGKGPESNILAASAELVVVQKANIIQTERARKRRREGHLPEEPTSTPLPVGSIDTKSYDADVYVEKRRNEVEVEMVKSKGVQKSTKKSPVKKV
ncbi:hypothetical protein H5410_047149 [Solanum commersonii]|uniref:Uncharacterized protein n=1 Tax=Solanum commersonii TaxID=4109 RepID=A0A9J5XEB3_SOLCO|nr:hypothetical protein H5410_047149 [Solanum commersonii]